jgi:Transposase
MRRKRYSEEQIISILKEQQAGTPVPELAHHRRSPHPTARAV